MVGVTGLEPATSRPPAVRATTALHPVLFVIINLKNKSGHRAD